MSYYRIDVTMKNGFKYSYTCVARMMPGMKESSHGYWVDKVESTEITKEDHEATWGVYKEPAKKPEKVIPMSDPPKKKSLEKKTAKLPKMASLEDFFEVDEKPKRKKK